MTAIAARPTSVRWRIVVLLMALCFISHFNRISMSVAGTERIIGEFGIDPEIMGRVYSAFLLVYTISMALGGYIIDRYGVRLALMFMAIGSGTFAAITGLVGLVVVSANTLLPALLIVRGAMGLLTTPLHPASAQSITNWMPPTERARTNGLVTGAALLGIASSYPLFGKMIDWVDWPVAFLIAGTITILLGLVWGSFATDRPVPEQSPVINGARADGTAAHRGSWAALLRNSSLLWLTLAYSAVGYFQYLFFYWMQYYFDSVLSVGKVQSRWSTAIPTLVMAVCMPLGGWVSDQMEQLYGHTMGRKIVPMGGMLMSAALLGLGLITHKPAAMVFWFALSMGALGTAEGAFWLTAVELGGKRGGTAASIINIGGNGVGLLGPLLTPIISKYLGWKWGISIGGLVCIAGSLCWWPIRIPNRAATSATPLEST